jgi:hypothetical protein
VGPYTYRWVLPAVLEIQNDPVWSSSCSFRQHCPVSFMGSTSLLPFHLKHCWCRVWFLNRETVALDWAESKPGIFRHVKPWLSHEGQLPILGAFGIVLVVFGGFLVILFFPSPTLKSFW